MWTGVAQGHGVGKDASGSPEAVVRGSPLLEATSWISGPGILMAEEVAPYTGY